MNKKDGISFVKEAVMKMTLKIAQLMLVIMVLAGMTDFAHGATVRISWSANSEPDLAGYKVYYGTTSRESGSYSHVVNAGLSTYVDISGLSSGATYYFAVTAYDDSNNESGYSAEAHALIPDETAVAPTDTDMDGIPDQIEVQIGLDPTDPFDSLEDTDGDGVVNLVEYMAGTSPTNINDHPVTDNILKDVIGEAGKPIDLSSINPEGSYSIVPLDESYPAPEENMVAMDSPGAYLYNVVDQQSMLVYRLRISVTDTLSTLGAYSPGILLDLTDQTFGIRVSLPGDAMIRQVPIGIGGLSTGNASAQSLTGETTQFDILPFGLVLAKPAVITVNCEGSNPTVQRYNDSAGSWVNMENVSSEPGKVSFSSDQLGTFRIVSDGQVAATPPSDGGGGGGGGGGGCFISTAGL